MAGCCDWLAGHRTSVSAATPRATGTGAVVEVVGEWRAAEGGGGDGVVVTGDFRRLGCARMSATLNEVMRCGCGWCWCWCWCGVKGHSSFSLPLPGLSGLDKTIGWPRG